MELQTRIEYADLLSRFEVFFSGVYYNHLLEAVQKKQSVVVTWEDFERFDHELADYLLENPEECFKAIDESISNIDVGETFEKKINVRFTKLPERHLIPIKNLRSKHIKKFIAISGIIKQASEVRPEITAATFECKACGERMTLLQDKESTELTTPYMCECGNKRGFELVTRRLVDLQRMELEENPESLEGTSQARKLGIYVKDDLVDPKFQKKIIPGNKVHITGIMYDMPMKMEKGKESKRRDIYLEGNYVETVDREFEDIQITKEDEEKIKDIAARSEVYALLVKSIAPSIYGYESIKEAIALQLFGGVRKIRPDGATTRGDIHMLLIGDPGAGKSQLIKYVTGLAPKARYVVGKSASGAGLTATVVKDEFMKGWALEAGALVLANKGLCAIDELDKMGTEDRSAMHEVMEQQCYHPDTEIILAEGKKVKIGPFVEQLMEENRDDVYQGKDCEILPVDNIHIQTTDMRKVFTTPVARVSRHKAPNKLYKITYANGRSITVTPEHPTFTFANGKIAELRADQIKTGMLAPAPLLYKTTPKAVIQLAIPEVTHPNMKQIAFPSILTPELSRFLGYLASEGHCYKNEEHRYAEIGVTNTNPQVIEEMKALYTSVFGVMPNVLIQNHDAGMQVQVIRSPSLLMYDFFQMNFPELMTYSITRAIPQKIREATQEIQQAFLQTFFSGDGFVDQQRFGYITSSYDLAKGLQDLLLNNTVWSYIATEKRKEGTYYKVVVSGKESMRTFMNIIASPTDKRREKITKLVERSSSRDNSTDVVPYEIVRKLYTLLGKYRLLDGYFNKILKNKQNSNRLVVKHYLEKIEKKAQLTGMILQKEIDEIKQFVDSEIRFVSVKDVEVIENHNLEWVYDVTIEPTRTFLSEGLVLHNTVTISKANIQATLSAKTTILAAANPKFGRFDAYTSIPEQIDLPDTLLSRFDLIFPIRDIPSKEKDTKLVRHILALHANPERQDPPLDSELLRKYIAFAKANCKPVLTQEAQDEIERFYVTLRNKYSSEEVPAVPIGARQLEAIVRLSEASAKIRLSDKVEVEDAKRSIRILTECLMQVGIDPETGKFDIDRLESGTTTSQRNKIRIILKLVEDMQKETDDKLVPMEDLIAAAEEQGIQGVEQLVKKLKEEGELFEPKQGFLKKV